jgi:hypothetical protein
MASLRKNTASQNITFALINASSGAALTGATVIIYVTKDNGSQASGGGTATELGHGQYNYAPTQAETNATDVGFIFSATSAIPVNLDFHPDVVDGNGYLDVNLVDIAGSALSTSTAQLGVNLVSVAGSAVNTNSAQLGVNLVSIGASALNTNAAQLGVNLVNIAGTASTGTAGYVGIDWGNVHAPTSTNVLSGTTISTSQVITTVSGNVNGSVNSVTAPITLNLSQTLNAARALDVISDTSLTINDGFVCAIAGAAGQKETSGTSYVVQTPHTATTIRTFTMTLVVTPSTVPSAIN